MSAFPASEEAKSATKANAGIIVPKIPMNIKATSLIGSKLNSFPSIAFLLAYL